MSERPSLMIEIDSVDAAVAVSWEQDPGSIDAAVPGYAFEVAIEQPSALGDPPPRLVVARDPFTGVPWLTLCAPGALPHRHERWADRHELPLTVPEVRPYRLISRGSALIRIVLGADLYFSLQREAPSAPQHRCVWLTAQNARRVTVDGRSAITIGYASVPKGGLFQVRNAEVVGPVLADAGAHVTVRDGWGFSTESSPLVVLARTATAEVRGKPTRPFGAIHIQGPSQRCFTVDHAERCHWISNGHRIKGVRLPHVGDLVHSRELGDS